MPRWAAIASTLCLSCVFLSVYADSSVIWRDSKFVFVPDSIADNAIAWGSFQDTIASTGWGVLTLESSSKHSDFIQASALGFLEGVLTRNRIAQMWESVKYLHGRESSMTFLANYNDYIRSEIKSRGLELAQLAELRGSELVAKLLPQQSPAKLDRQTDPHQLIWIQASLLIAQLDGLRDGFNSASTDDGEKMTTIDALLLQFDADSLDVEQLQKRIRELRRKIRRIRELRKQRGEQVDDSADDEIRVEIADESRDGASRRDASIDEDEPSSAAELLELMTRQSRCTALIKLTKHELLAAHSTWEMYTEMLRVYKHIKTHFATVSASQHMLSDSTINLSTASVFDRSNYESDDEEMKVPEWRRISLRDRDAPSISDSQQMSFSSYPGFLTSTDDFYMLSSGMTVLETTLTMLDADVLIGAVKPVNALLGWQRHMIANRLARSPAQWVDLMSTLNSGTMNSQWVIIDYQLIRRAQRQAFSDENDDEAMLQLPYGSVIVAEQLPQSVITEDVSEEINERGYFAGFNLPRADQSKRIFMGRFADVVGSDPEFNYGSSKRAQLIARDQHRIKSALDLGRLLRSNAFAVGDDDDDDEEYDSITDGRSCHALGARCDLPNRKLIKDGEHENAPVAYGATDVKITSASDSELFTAAAISGPAHNQQTYLPPFSWSQFERIRKEYIEDHPAWSKKQANQISKLNEQDPRITKSFGDFNSVNSDIAPFMPPHFGQPDTFNFGWVEMKPAFK